MASEILRWRLVEGSIQADYQETVIERRVRAYGARPARVECDHHQTIQAAIDESALNQACKQPGRRIYASSKPEQTMTQAVLTYRREDIIENLSARLKGWPLSLRPLCLQRDDRKIGLVRRLTVSSSALTLVQFSLRRQLSEKEAVLENLYGGVNTDKPATERILNTFQEIMLTVICLDNQIWQHITPLTQTQKQILDLLEFPLQIYKKMNKFSQTNGKNSILENSA